MIFKANRGGAVGGAVLQIGAEAWNLPSLSFLSCGSAQSSCVLLCSQLSSDAGSVTATTIKSRTPISGINGLN
jgi:hypothetical protein